MKVTYAVTAYNEERELKQLLPFLLEEKREEDEILVLMDEKGPDTVFEYLSGLKGIKFLHLPFYGDFAGWKNFLTKAATGDVIFQIDADEAPSEYLIRAVPLVMEQNPDLELVYVPRINIVKGLTEDYIMRWGWKVNDRGWVNFPDYQSRIYRKQEHIRWKGRVHETIKGHRTFDYLPPTEEFCLLHEKTFQRQLQQNAYYDTL